MVMENIENMAVKEKKKKKKEKDLGSIQVILDHSCSLLDSIHPCRRTAAL